MYKANPYRRYTGYQRTPPLWKGKLEGLTMFSPTTSPASTHPEVPQVSHMRLGKLMEQFVLNDLQAHENIQLLSSNIQVFLGQTTIGELDCLLKQSGVPIHLEIVFKFYLYDPALPQELHRWIGPNRNDTLIFKLKKLKEKQLPLLHAPETAPLLKTLGLSPAAITQQVYFKAQLFVPFQIRDAVYPLINPDCIMGFYLRPHELGQFKEYSFYIPDKLDWPIEPHMEVEWVQAEAFHTLLAEKFSHNRSPLCWMKSPEGILNKFFVVWWE